MGDSIKVRRGRETDADTILSLWDAAIAWLVVRGQTEQWGTEPASARASCRHAVQEWASCQGLRIAELDEQPVGVGVVVESCPNYVPSTDLRESYLLFLVANPAHTGHGIGATLVEHAAREARADGSKLLRVDCWAGAPDLVGWYERHGFAKTDTFTVNDGWHGQVFEMML
jgi:GNAT superfamily N-acetyltransferase